MSYAKKTFEDSNAIKRFFQNARLEEAMALVPGNPDPGLIVDFGAGNGELCKHLSRRFPRAEIVCYEPHPDLREQAMQNLEGIDHISFVNDPADLPLEAADCLFCLEVFEHLPERELAIVTQQIRSTLAETGSAIIGVPIEIGIAALYKGIFRMFRRFGEFDARLPGILAAVFCHPPADRPVAELMPSLYFHLHHLGFDYRRFSQQLGSDFQVVNKSTSPFPSFAAILNSEQYYVVTR
jgi:SAM-dependent methyltransferase